MPVDPAGNEERQRVLLEGAALTKTLVSTTSLIQHAARLPFELAYRPIDVVIAEARGDHEAARFLPGFGEPVVRLDH